MLSDTLYVPSCFVPSSVMIASLQQETAEDAFTIDYNFSSASE